MPLCKIKPKWSLDKSSYFPWKLRSMKTVLTLAVISGDLHFGSSSASKRRFKVYRVLITLFMILLLIHEIPTMQFWIWTINHHVSSFLAFFEIVIRWGLLFVNPFITALNENRLHRHFEKLLQLNVTIPKKSARKLCIFQALRIIFGILLCLSYQGVGNWLVWQNANFHCYTPIIYVLTELKVMATNVQFTELMYFVREYVKVLNNRLQSVGQNQITEIGTPMVYHLYGKNKNDVKLIIRLRCLHLKLSSIAHEINLCFSIQLLLLICQYMLELIYSLRQLSIFLSTSAFATVLWTARQWTEAILSLSWAGHYVNCLLQVVISCELTRAEFQKTSDIAHELLNGGLGENLDNEILRFSHQLFQKDMVFSAGGLFNLQLSLIRTMAGAIITYLIIILTFRDN